MMPCGEYIVDIIIPPRKYISVEVEDAPDNTETVEERNRHTETTAIPLDLDSVVLRVWPVAVQTEQEASEGMI
jgi:hypothetical protein